MSTTRRAYPDRTKAIHDTKVALVLRIINESRRTEQGVLTQVPITAREISRRILGQVESPVYHLMPSEVSAIIRIHLSKLIKAESVCSGGAVMMHYTPVPRVTKRGKLAVSRAGV